jgi:hypothetical protein
MAANDEILVDIKSDGSLDEVYWDGPYDGFLEGPNPASRLRSMRFVWRKVIDEWREIERRREALKKQLLAGSTEQVQRVRLSMQPYYRDPESEP